MMKLLLVSFLAAALLLPSIVCANDVWEDEGGGGGDVWEQGQDMWEDGEGGGGGYEYSGGDGVQDSIDALTGILMEQGMAIALQCDIDILGIAGAAGSMSGADAGNGLTTPGTGAGANSVFDMETFKSIATMFAAPTCSASEADQFRSAFQEFETCSTFDLEKILESMEDALVGAFLECAVAVAPLVDALTSSNPADEFVIPDMCVESFFGKNPLGDMLRTMHLKPDQVLPCFSTLSTNIPSCTLQRWPIPLVGPILKKATCLFGAAMPLLEELAKFDLKILNTCLPPQDESQTLSQAAVCQDTIAQCIKAGSSSMDMAEPLLGAPLSDAVKRVAAKENGLEDVPARYQSFVESCVTNVWQGWSYENHDYQDGTSISVSAPKQPVVPPPATSPTSTSGNSSPENTTPCDASSSPLLGAKQAQQNAYVANESSGGGSSPSAGGHFGGGLLTGVILTGALWAFMTYRQKKALDSRKSYETVEMVGAGGYSVA